MTGTGTSRGCRCSTSMPSRSGSPRSRTTTSGRVRATLERGGPVCAGDLVPGRAGLIASARGQRELVVHDQDASGTPPLRGPGPAGTVTTMVSPPPGVSSTSMVAPPRRRGRARRPGPVRRRRRRGVPSRWNGANMGLAGLGTPGPWSTMRRSSEAPACTACLVEPHGAVGGGVADGVQGDVGDDPFEQTGVGVDERDRRLVSSTTAAAGTPQRAVHDLVERRRARAGRPPRSAAGRGRAGSPAARRAGRPASSALSSIRRSRRVQADCSAIAQAGEALIVASGVRRSWDTAASSAVRTVSVSRSRSPSAACRDPFPLQTARPRRAAKASSRRRSDAAAGRPPGPARALARRRRRRRRSPGAGRRRGRELDHLDARSRARPDARAARRRARRTSTAGLVQHGADGVSRS